MPIHELIRNAHLDEIDLMITALVAQGCSNREIAQRVYLSYQTVRNRLTRIFDATGAANRTQLAVLWLEENR